MGLRSVLLEAIQSAFRDGTATESDVLKLRDTLNRVIAAENIDPNLLLAAVCFAQNAGDRQQLDALLGKLSSNLAAKRELPFSTVHQVEAGRRRGTRIPVALRTSPAASLLPAVGQLAKSGALPSDVFSPVELAKLLQQAVVDATHADHPAVQIAILNECVAIATQAGQLPLITQLTEDRDAAIAAWNGLRSSVPDGEFDLAREVRTRLLGRAATK